MPEVLAAQLRRALARAEAGKALSVQEATALVDARGEGLDRLMSIAARLRDLGHGDVVTYSRKVFVPLTMLCRDHCHYCTFAKPPARLEAPFLTPEEAVAIAEAGRAMGCKEALFTLGDRPEDRYDVARDWLAQRGYGSTLDYVRAVAIQVLEATGLLPHLNPGVMSYEELARLKQVAPSMGLMLETSSARLSERGGPHFGSPDKDARRPPAHDRGRRQARRAVHHRDPGGHRRDGRRARAIAPRDPRGPSAVPPHPRGHRPELPGEARHRDARGAGARGGGVPRRGRHGPRGAGSGHACPGASEPQRPGAAREAPRRRHRRLGRRVAAHAGPRQPREAVAQHRDARRHHGRAGASTSASGSRSTRSSRCARTRSRRQDARPGRRAHGRRRPRGRGAPAGTDRRGRTPTSSGSRAPSHSRSPRRRRGTSRRRRGRLRRHRRGAGGHAGVAPPGRRPSAARRRHPLRAPQGPASSSRSPTRRRSPSSAPRARPSTPCAPLPTACAPRPWGTTSPT